MSHHSRYIDPPDPPETLTPELRNAYYPPERGGCLSLWLIGNFALVGLGIFTVCNALVTLSNRNIRFDGLPDTAQAFMLIGLALPLGWTICLIAIWYWKKWGVYGFILLSFLNLGLEIVLSPQTLNAGDFLSPLISNAVLLYLVINRWNDFI